MTRSIDLALDGAVATVLLDRPWRFNALARADWEALEARIAEIEASPGIGCVIVRGAGGRAFSTGLDMSRFADERRDPHSARAYSEATERACGRIGALPMPTIAMIEGFCMGSGVDIACRCDLRIAAADARFRVSPRTIGLFLDTGFVAAMLAVIGRARTLELVLEGRTYDAAAAQAMGLVGRVVETDALEDETRALAARLADSYAAISSNRSTSTSP
ncbi:MAG: enoyl-CoA hydratase/isomerase family protein [Defluviicoccus sp.]|nr:enoyl-CoA hydratase/isomerase family protein [Defluviicoccus sp.]